MKTSKNYYLPALDSRTSRMESIAFGGLGLAGAVLIAAAMTNGAHFARDRETVIEAWSTSGPAQVELAGTNPDRALTNLLRAHAAKARTHADTSLERPASAASEALKPQRQSMVDETPQRWNIGALQ